MGAWSCGIPSGSSCWGSFAALPKFDDGRFRVLAFRALECPHIVIGLVVRFDTGKGHLCPAFRTIRPLDACAISEETCDRAIPRLLASGGSATGLLVTGALEAEKSCR